MSSPTIVLDKIIEKIVGIAFESVGRHLGYLFHYKQNMKNLEVEMNKLQERRRTIEGKIDEAKTSGEVIVDNVSDWLNGADMLREGVETFMDEKTIKENIQCFKVSCPDFISRYRLSKKAIKKMGDVKSLSEKADFNTVAHPAPPPPELQFPSSETYVSFDSRKSIFNEIMEALTNPKVNVIGVYGAGGVGKTTMVEKVGEQVKKDGLFDEVVIAVVSQNADVIRIQGVLADRLNLKLDSETEVGRAIKLWNRLNNGKRNLVILDDIWKELKLKEIGIPITDGNKGCKIVLTSRNKHDLQNTGVENCFSIEVLLQPEAWNLFKEEVGNDVESDAQLHNIAYAVCNECRGLPVAIRAVGAALKGKSMYAWKSSLDKLQKSMLNKIEDIDPKLFTSLRLSYDYLESTDAKSCFLLCCLFPEDAQIPIDELARHCMARRLLEQSPDTLEDARDIICAVVNTLKTRCLLLDGEDDDFVKMHDIVRDVAISIAKGSEEAFLVKHGVKEWPETGTYEKYSAISLSSKIIHDLPDELVCPKLHTLMLECSSSEFQPDLNAEFFRGTEKLVVLELNSLTLLQLPSSLGKLTELRMLCLIDCKLGDIAIVLKHLKNKLEILRLRGSDITALPPEVGELTRLRLLDLEHCDSLEVIPSGVISKLHRLEELHFPDNFDFDNWEATTANKEISRVSLDELKSLDRLSTLYIHIPDHRLLPPDLGFLNLSRFYITVGGQHYDVHHPSNGVLELEGISSDDDFNILERLLGKPKWCAEKGGSFNNLTEVIIENCRLKYLFSPSCARGLPQLQSLEIRNCDIMEAIIGEAGEKDEEMIADVINFRQLKYLRLSHLPSLISFYPRIKKATTSESHSFPPAQSLFNEKVSFPALEELHIYKVPNITEIWDKTLLPAESFCLLSSLEVWNCEKLMNVVPSSHMLPLLRNLKRLKVERCPEMEVIVVFDKMEEETQEATINKDIIVFPELREMILYDLENLEGVCAYKSEDQLNFNVQVAFLESFCLLSILEVRECKKLMNVVPSSHMIPLLRNLKTFKVADCPKMEVIVVLEKREEKAQEASANTDIIVFSKLETMELIRLESLKGVWGYKSEDFNMQVVFEGEMMEALIGNEGEKDEEVIENEVNFSQLENLVLDELPRLISFHPRIKKARAGNHYFAPAQSLFNKKVGFPALKELYVSSMHTITAIWDMQTFPVLKKVADSSFSQLRSMAVRDCSNLVNVVLQGFPDMEVRGTELEIKEKQVDHNYVLQFPQLMSLKLEELTRLSSFNNTSMTTESRPLFNFQVSFPALEELHITSVPNITEIWDKTLLPVESFCLLSSLEVWGCGKLMNVVPSHMLPRLRNLKRLEVIECPEMKVIVVFEKMEEETQEATINKDIIVFPKLREMILLYLDNLEGVCAYKSEDQLNFNVQVAFLESFCLLSTLEVGKCKKLMNVVPSSHMIPLLRNLKTFTVADCPKMEVIVVLEKREEKTQEASANTDIIVFSELKTMKLKRLESLKGVWGYKSEDFNMQAVFESEMMEALIGNEGEKDEEVIENVVNFSQLENLYLDKLPCFISFHPRIKKATTTNHSFAPAQFLFNKKVAFPALKELYVSEMHTITAIWDMQTFSALEKAADSSFSQLRTMVVMDCSNLVNVVLQGFPKMGVRGTEEIKEKQVDHNYVLQFPQLRDLTLSDLGRLSSFSNNSITTETRPLFNNQKLETLYVQSCPEMEVIVVLEKREEETQEATINKDIILKFPELRRLWLVKLGKLKGVCAYKSEDQLYFNVQVVFPKLTIQDLDEHTMKIFTEATSNKKECATTDASGSGGGMQLQP